MSGWRQGQQRKISAQKTAGGGEPQSQATGAVLFNKHGNIRQCNQAIASGRWTAAALRLRTARRQRRSFKETPCQVDGKLKPWWWWKRYNRAPGAEGSGAGKMKPAVGPDTEAWLHKFMGPLLFPALYPPTCISKIFLRPEPCKWTPASASEKGKNVVAPAAGSRPFTTASRKVHHWHKPYKHICLLRLSLPQRRSEASPTPR